MSFKRLKEAALFKLLERKRSLMLFGPRQTGKSTLLEKIFSGFPSGRILSYYFQLPSVRTRIESDPEVIKREVEGIKPSEPVFLLIDEIQKIPQVMDLLQYLIDKKKVVAAATGSSARKMKKAGTNWLPGRIVVEHLYPLTWEETELREAELPEVLRFGSLPGILTNKDFGEREKELASYTHLYLEEEIRMEAAVRNIPRFAKFLQLASLESGTAPNFSKIGGQVGLSHTSIREYFQILEDTLIVHRLNAFGNRRDAVLRQSKYYFFDLGVRNAAAQIGHSEGILTLQRGILFEHFIVLELLARLQNEARFYYWRSKKGEEVDLVLENKNQIVPLEIKATERPRSGDFTGLEAFLKRYRLKTGYLICQVRSPQKFGSCLAIPWGRLKEYL